MRGTLTVPPIEHRGRVDAVWHHHTLSRIEGFLLVWVMCG